MSRTQRLLDLIQILRGRHYPVSAAVLASELGVSKRTVYRDVVTLQAQGAPIDGEARSWLYFAAQDPDGHRLRFYVPALR